MSLAESLAFARGNNPDGTPRTGPSEVWCITRFNRNDNMVELYWSEKNVKGALISYSPFSKGEFRPYGGKGAHAECVMIRAFGASRRHYFPPNGVGLDIAEIYLSRSPCLDSSEVIKS